MLATLATFLLILAGVAAGVWLLRHRTTGPSRLPRDSVAHSLGLFVLAVVGLMAWQQAANPAVAPELAAISPSLLRNRLAGAIAVGLFIAAVLLAGFVFPRWPKRRALFLAERRALRRLPIVAALAIAVVGGTLALSLVLSQFGVAGDHQLVATLRRSGTPSLWLLVIVSAGIVAPLQEEAMFRVVLQGYLRRFVSPTAAIAGQAALFAAVHEVAVMLTVLPLAVAAGWLYDRTGSYALAVALHAAFNLSMLSVLALQVLSAAHA